MKPKEKAKKLVYKYYDLLKPNTDLENCKHCTLISVNELIEEADFTDGYYDRKEYWQEVKQEIEKL